MAFKETGIEYPVVWLEAGLHNQPGVLRDKISEELRRISGVDRVLMVMGHCGGATVGLESGDFEVVIPKADDCLSILLGSMKKRAAASREAATFFLTDGWMRHANNLLADFKRDTARFGPQKAERIYRIILKHYQRFGFIDTMTYDLDKAMDRIAHLSGVLEMTRERLPGDYSWLYRLLTGPWSEDEFLILPPRQVLDADMWGWITELPAQLA